MRRNRKGMTLIEVMFAALIAGVALVSIVGMSRLMMRTAYNNIADGVALHSATGILEQTRIQLYSSLQKAAVPGGGGPVLTYYYFDDVDQLRKAFTLQANYNYITDTNNSTASANQAAQVPNVYMGVAINADSSIDLSKSVPMDMEIVSLLLTDVSTTLPTAPGITVQLTYRYRAASFNSVYKSSGKWNVNNSVPWRVRVLKTFIPQTY